MIIVSKLAYKIGLIIPASWSKDSRRLLFEHHFVIFCSVGQEQSSWNYLYSICFLGISCIYSLYAIIIHLCLFSCVNYFMIGISPFMTYMIGILGIFGLDIVSVFEASMISWNIRASNSSSAARNL